MARTHLFHSLCRGLDSERFAGEYDLVAADLPGIGEGDATATEVHRLFELNVPELVEHPGIRHVTTLRLLKFFDDSRFNSPCLELP